MKKHFWMALALFMSVGTADVSAQSFLKKLKQKVEAEVENRVTNEAKKHVDKVVDKVGEAVTGSKSESNSRQSNASQSQSQSDDIYTTATKKVTVTAIDPMVERGPVTGKHNGHEWIDLGLPSGLKWATCNVDATTPLQHGKLYAWGELAPKATYTQANSKTYDKDITDFSGDPAYDVATKKWGKGWRMPTEAEFKELLNYTHDGFDFDKNGRVFENLANKRTLFLPAAGYNHGNKVQYPNKCGAYWTSTSTEQPDGGISLIFNEPYGEMSTGERSYGNSIRPVMDYEVKVEIPYDGETDGHKWVDLGLPSGLKWATSNVGTDEIDQDGIQFSWGGTIGWYEKKRATHADPNEVQHDITGDKRYDAATARWSDAWFMPTLYDYVELMENCTFEWTNLGRREGLKVTSKHNGKYIFLPASGKSNGDFKEDVNELLTYWTSSHIPGWQNKMEAYGFKASKTEAIFRSENRWTNGYSIRAVTK
mgnify:FL=1